MLKKKKERKQKKVFEIEDLYPYLSLSNWGSSNLGFIKPGPHVHLPRTLTLNYTPAIFVALEKSLNPGILIYEMECVNSYLLSLF